MLGVFYGQWGPIPRIYVFRKVDMLTGQSRTHTTAGSHLTHTYAVQEGELRPQLLDRFGMSVQVRTSRGEEAGFSARVKGAGI